MTAGVKQPASTECRLTGGPSANIGPAVWQICIHVLYKLTGVTAKRFSAGRNHSASAAETNSAAARAANP